MASEQDELAERYEAARKSHPRMTREDYDQRTKDARLSMLPMARIPVAALAGFGTGLAMGMAHGSTMAGLRFRAEHAHRLPTSTAGWYLYHKSKNYHLAFGGLGEGFRMGARLSILTVSMFCAENLFDVYRGSKDMLNTVAASLAVAGGYSLISQFSPQETARTARKGIIFGILYGGAQDLLSLAKGRHVGYVEFVRKQLGFGSESVDDEEVV